MTHHTHTLVLKTIINDQVGGSSFEALTWIHRLSFPKAQKHLTKHFGSTTEAGQQALVSDKATTGPA